MIFPPLTFMTYLPEVKQCLKLLRVALWLADYLCWLSRNTNKGLSSHGLLHDIAEGLLKYVAVESPFYSNRCKNHLCAQFI